MMTSAEVIARLASEGVNAVECPLCGRVREMVDRRIGLHGNPLCEGGGLLVEPSSEARAASPLLFDAPAEIMEEGLEDLCAHDAVQHHIMGCFAAMACESGECDHAEGEEHNESPATSDFDGCPGCVGREAMEVTWSYAAHSERDAIIGFLLGSVQHPAVSVKARRVFENLLGQIGEGQHLLGEEGDSGV